MKKHFKTGFIILTTMVFIACQKDDFTPTCNSTEAVTYTNKVKAIIDNNCLGCHGAGSDDGEWNTFAGLSEVLMNGRFETEVLIEQSMPRFGSLEEEELNTIKCWVENGYVE